MHHALEPFLWDNFNKTDGSHSVRYGHSNKHSMEFINRAALALPSPKICLNKTCQSQCQNSCYWEKERIPSETNFDEIYLNNHELMLKTNLQNVDQGLF